MKIWIVTSQMQDLEKTESYTTKTQVPYAQWVHKLIDDVPNLNIIHC